MLKRPIAVAAIIGLTATVHSIPGKADSKGRVLWTTTAACPTVATLRDFVVYMKTHEFTAVQQITDYADRLGCKTLYAGTPIVVKRDDATDMAACVTVSSADGESVCLWVPSNVVRKEDDGL